MHWFAQAPSNIALIKYMGKKKDDSNLPDNPSLSYTLKNLLSSVMLEPYHGGKDLWEPLDTPGAECFALSLAGQNRFLSHLARLKNFFNYSGNFIVRSTNNFPQSSGLASSASSFAALTKCAMISLSELCDMPLPSLEIQAQQSMQGSGSSCRSFFSPWALWQEDKIRSIALPYPELQHQVILISHAEKEVLSTEAHRRVKTSPHYVNRPQRASENLKTLLAALEAKDWQNAFQIAWREFQDMHLLFTTSAKPFSYMTPNTEAVLRDLQNLWQTQGDGPIVTMDAGPNIHLLYRPDQRDLAQQFKQDHLVGNYDVL